MNISVCVCVLCTLLAVSAFCWLVFFLVSNLLREGLLSSAWRESAEGLPPRKYYTITEQGRRYLEAMGAEWDNLLSAIDEIKGG